MKLSALLLLSLAFGSPSHQAPPQAKPPVHITAAKASGVFKVGETVEWKITGDQAMNVKYRVLAGGLTEVDKGDLNINTSGSEFAYTFGKPGAILLEVKYKDAGGKDQKVLAGAVAEPDKIKPNGTKPDDFDEFWAKQIEELNKIPMNAKEESVDLGRQDIKYSKITLDNINGSKIRGQLARPAQGEKLPALLIVQWAGVYPLEKPWAVGRAQDGWLTLNVMAHDLPIDEPASFYKEQSDGPLKNYPAIGNESRDTSYFKRMYLSCYRAAEYLTTRADWDGKTLVVMGTSQGGLQTFVTAAIHPKITGALALVPAGADLAGPEAGRAPGWPQWYWQVQGKDAKAVREAGRYYDVVNFASRIKCPMLVGLGLIDETCPPEGVLAAFNLVKGPKQAVIMPNATHQRNQEEYGKRCYGMWLPALKEGKVPTLQALGN